MRVRLPTSESGCGRPAQQRNAGAPLNSAQLCPPAALAVKMVGTGPLTALFAWSGLAAITATPPHRREPAGHLMTTSSSRAASAAAWSSSSSSSSSSNTKRWSSLTLPCAAGQRSTSGHTLCGCVQDGGRLNFNCPQGTFTAVKFASLGTPLSEKCGNFSAGKCDSDEAVAKASVAKLCVGKGQW
eukprot:COSAG01_NODE_5901_length_3963_cov_4.069876_4_plen_185_part_00